MPAGPRTVADLDLKPALEAVLMVVDEPATEEHLAKVAGAAAPAGRRRAAGAGRRVHRAGPRLRAAAGRGRLAVLHPGRVRRRPSSGFVLDGQQARLTQAALETLAVVAYRQPVSRSRVSAVRGVNCDGVMRTLLQRGLVEEAGTEPETGAILYRTTNYFLERMGLRGLDELPELAPFLPEAEAIEAETQEGVPSFDPDAPDAPIPRQTTRRKFDAKQRQGQRQERRARQPPAAAGGEPATVPGRPGGPAGARRQGGATTGRTQRRPASPAPRSAATTSAPAPGPRGPEVRRGPRRAARGGAKGGPKTPQGGGRAGGPVAARSRATRPRELDAQIEERNRDRYADKPEIKTPKTFPGAEQEGERLQKILARAGLGSRRACEELIEQARVEVNGEIVLEQGKRVDPEKDEIKVDGLTVATQSYLFFSLNKPAGVVSTMEDPDGRQCLGDYVTNRETRLFHVGRLDTETEGIILLTNHGELAHRLTHPKYGVKKIYLAAIAGPIPRDLGKRLKDGIQLEDGYARADHFRVVEQTGKNYLVEVTLHEGRKHIVRRMLAEAGFPVEQAGADVLRPDRPGRPEVRLAAPPDQHRGRHADARGRSVDTARPPSGPRPAPIARNSRCPRHAGFLLAGPVPCL